MVMQLRHWYAHGHSHFGNAGIKPYGNGVVLWFQSDNIENAFARGKRSHAQILEPLNVNVNANHHEFCLSNPDGYVVVVAGVYGAV